LVAELAHVGLMAATNEIVHDSHDCDPCLSYPLGAIL